MNFNPFFNQNFDDMDPNYIYPKPYIDPSMYSNQYFMNPNPFYGYPAESAQPEYMTYMNPYVNNPFYNNDVEGLDNFSEVPNNMFEDSFDFENLNNTPNTMHPMNPFMNMPPQSMMMLQCMPFFPPNMMMHPMNPFMNNMSPINMEEFDEEEM